MNFSSVTIPRSSWPHSQVNNSQKHQEPDIDSQRATNEPTSSAVASEATQCRTNENESPRRIARTTATCKVRRRAHREAGRLRDSISQKRNVHKSTRFDSSGAEARLRCKLSSSQASSSCADEQDRTEPNRNTKPSRETTQSDAAVAKTHTEAKTRTGRKSRHKRSSAGDATDSLDLEWSFQLFQPAGGRQSGRARGDGFYDEEQLISRCCSPRLTSRGTTRRGRTKADAHSIEVTRLGSLYCGCVIHVAVSRCTRWRTGLDVLQRSIVTPLNR